MAEAIKISTGKYKKSGKVNIDGMVWDVVLPGAATEMRLMQAQRRLTLLDQKVEDGIADENDLDKYDEYEKVIVDTFRGMFKDSTKDNSEVNKWIDETPMAFIAQAFEDIKSGSTEQTTSS